MGFENFNLDQVAENAHKRSNKEYNANDLFFDVNDGKMKISKSGTPLPRTAVVANEMTDEGFAL